MNRIRVAGSLAGPLLALLLLSGFTLASEPTTATQKWQPTGANHVARGRSPAANYLLRCSGCHGLDGSGLIAGGIPPFPGFIDVFFKDEESRLYMMHVPGVVSASLTNQEIAEVMNYILDRWGAPDHGATYYTEAEVTELREQPVADVVLLRRSITQRLAEEGVVLPEYPWP